LILVIAVLLTWQTILPSSVVSRITMTETETGEIEGSAAHRLDLWEHAMNLFKQNPVFGVGFGGFGLDVPEGELTDTHNFYMKTLAEQGVIGFTVLVAVFFAALRSGWKLMRIGKSSFHKGLGLGFMGCIVALMVTNMFGDRWSYFVLGSYFWIFWGLVDRARLIANTQTQPGISVSEQGSMVKG
jgi:O-antigen ligase